PQLTTSSSFSSLFFLSTIRPPPRSTLFPYTTLFRSDHRAQPRHPCRADHLRPQARRPLCRLRPGQASSPGRARRDRDLRHLRRRSEEHTSELQSLTNLVCRLLLEKKNKNITPPSHCA